MSINIDADPQTGQRARNPRREALKVLRAMSADIRAMVRVWDQDQRTYIGGKSRPLAEGEKRENSAAHWDQLAKYAGFIARRAIDVGTFAEAMARRVRAGERW